MPLAVPVEVKEQQTSDEISRVFRLTTNIVPGAVSFAQALPYQPQAKVICQFALPGDDTRLCVTGVVAESRRAVAFVSLDRDVEERIVRYAQERTHTP